MEHWKIGDIDFNCTINKYIVMIHKVLEIY